jgi:hypothetical protein
MDKTDNALNTNNIKSERSFEFPFITNNQMKEWIKIMKGATIKIKIPAVIKIEFFLFVAYIGTISLFNAFHRV